MPKLSPEDHLKFAAQVLETQIFGAFWLAIEARRKEIALTQSQLAERTGRDKTNISKLLDGPRNWTIRTISDLAEGLDLEVEFCLEDRLNRDRKFTPTGVYTAPNAQSPQIYGCGYLLNSNTILATPSDVRYGTFTNTVAFPSITNTVAFPSIQNVLGASFQVPIQRQQPVTGSAILQRTA